VDSEAFWANIRRKWTKVGHIVGDLCEFHKKPKQKEIYHAISIHVTLYLLTTIISELKISCRFPILSMCLSVWSDQAFDDERYKSTAPSVRRMIMDVKYLAENPCQSQSEQE
jgi:hypothetical protein